jgi:hypothetical protein
MYGCADVLETKPFHVVAQDIEAEDFESEGSAGENWCCF